MNFVRTIMMTALVVPAVLLGVTGCYSRLTTPKEALHYVDTEGQPVASKKATVILAPAYNQVVRDLSDPDKTQYRFRPGTRISVRVYGHSIGETVSIRPDGRIDLPLVGDVHVEGRTIREVKEEVSEKYAQFFVDPPQVIINTEVTDLNNVVLAGNVSVINPTGSQGVVNLTGDEMLSQILARVQGLNPRSEWNEIAIIRRGLATKERYVIVCDIEHLIRYGDLDQDVKMRNQDVVFIPAETNTLLQELFASVGVLGRFSQDLDLIAGFIERVEGY